MFLKKLRSNLINISKCLNRIGLILKQMLSIDVAGSKKAGKLVNVGSMFYNGQSND